MHKTTMNLYRVVVLGPGGVGKTSLVGQFINGFFSSTYHPTVEDSYRHSVQLTDGMFQTVEILDTAGMHQFPAMRELSIKSSQAFVLVYSVDSRDSLKEAAELHDQIVTIKGTNDVPVVLVGNKRECTTEREVTLEHAQEVAARLNCLHFEASARHNVNVDAVFMELLSKVYGLDKMNKCAKQKRLNKSRRLSDVIMKPGREKLKRHSSVGDSSETEDDDARCVIL